MAFALSSTTITQSGTDTSLAGLSAIAGVTTTTSNGIVIYNLGSSLKLRVTGTLTHDPDKEVIVSATAHSSTTSTAPISVSSTGTYNYGVTSVINSVTNYSTGVGIYLTSQAANFFNSYGIAIESGGKWNWNGGIISSASLFYVVAGGYLEQYAGTFFNTHPTVECQFRSNATTTTDSAKLNIRNLVLDGYLQATTLFLQFGSATGVFNFKRCFYQPVNGATNSTISFLNFANGSNKATKDFYFINVSASVVTGILTVTNPEKRLSYLQQTNNGNYGYVETRKNVQYSFLDTAGGAINTVSYCATDVNNGSRRVGVNNVANRTADITYCANNAVFPLTVNYLIEVCDVNGALTPNISVDSRTNTSNAIPTKFLAFGKEGATISQSLLGLNTTSVITTLLPDFSVVSASKAVVEALTACATSDNFYDLMHVFLLNNFQTYSNKLVTKTGDLIDAGAYNIVLDATAASVFAFNGTTITVKSSVFTGRLKTTGTINFNNGATINGTYQSVAGVSSRLQIAGITDSSVIVVNNLGVQFDYQTEFTGDYAINIPVGSTGTWSWVVKKQGFTHSYGTFTPAIGGVFSANVIYNEKLNPDGSNMYLNTSSPFVNVVFSGVTNAYIDISNGTAPLQATFDASENALVTSAGMLWLSSGKSDLSQFNSGSGDYLFMTEKWRLRRALTTDVNATLEAFAQSTDGIPVDEVNGPVRFLSTDSSATIATAVLAQIEASTVIAKKVDLQIINEGVKKASKLIPHSTNLS